MCLFCASVFGGAQEVFAHCKEQHHFDFEALRKEWSTYELHLASYSTQELDFYGSIKCINFIRHQVRYVFYCYPSPQIQSLLCTFCGCKFDSSAVLLGHMQEEQHCKVQRGASFWDDDRYLSSTIENDGLLCGLEELSSDEEESNHRVIREPISVDELEARLLMQKEIQ